MEGLSEIFLKLIANETCRKDFSVSAEALDEKLLLGLHSKARKHGVANILCAALLNGGYLENNSLKNFFENEMLAEFYLYEKMSASYQNICAVLEKEKLPYIPLKGAVIRDLYPEPWLRRSGDIDILVRYGDIKRAVNAMLAAGFVQTKESKHDVTFKTDDGVVLELHFHLLGNKKSPAYKNLVDGVWEYAEQCENETYRYRLNDGMFYCYHIVHMAKHFRLGGCGVRPFIDLWLMIKDKNYDTPEINSMLKKAELYDFNLCARRLCAVWFSGAPHDETTLLMQKFILDGGSFGSTQTHILAENQRRGSKFKYMLSRVFVPYDYLKNDYPILKKYPFFTPFCEICRVFSLLFGKKKNLRKSRVENVKNVSSEHIKEINVLFERVGLD